MSAGAIGENKKHVRLGVVGDWTRVLRSAHERLITSICQVGSSTSRSPPSSVASGCAYRISQPSYPVAFFFQAEDGIRDRTVTGVQTCALPIYCEYAVASCPVTYRALGSEVFCDA